MITSLSDTSIFKYTEMMSSQKPSHIIKDLVSEKNGTMYVTEEQLEDVFYKIRHKSFNFPAKFAVLELFKKGVIKLVYSERTKLTIAIPFFKFKMPTGGFGVIINISVFGKMKSDGTINIDALTLYTLMLSGAYSLVYDKTKGLILNNGLPELYSSLFVNTIARIVNLDPVKREKLKFITGKFIYMLLGSNEHAASVSAGRLTTLDSYSIEQLDLQLEPAYYENLEKLLEGINKVFPEFNNNLTLAIFFDRWLRMYGESSAMACEYVPFFITMFIALITNCNNLVNIKAIEKEANRNSRKLTVLFAKIENAVMELSER